MCINGLSRNRALVQRVIRCAFAAVLLGGLIRANFLRAQETLAPARVNPESVSTSDPAAEERWARHGFKAAQRESIRQVFREGIRRQFIPGGSLLILHRGEPVFREAFGVADLESGRPFALTAPIRIASLTKPHTATLLALLVDQKKLSWEDPVDKYLPQFAQLQVRGKGPVARSPMIRELLSHTAGFPGQAAIDAGQWTLKADGDLADAVADLAAQGLASEPGSVFAYTGVGYLVAGRIAEVATGQEFNTLMREQLLGPIGATTAVFYSAAAPEVRAAMPRMYERRDGQLVPRTEPARSEAALKFPTPGGSLVSTLDDVGRLLLLHRNHGMVGDRSLISATTLSTMYRPQPATGRDGYGLGFNIMQQDAAGVGTRIRHTGASGTIGIVDFQRDLIVVVLTQVPQTQTMPWRTQLLKSIDTVFATAADAGPRPLCVIDPGTPEQLRELLRYTGKSVPLVSAHRGGPQAGFPENCLATFENTLRHTCALMEIDPRFTKDGEIVVHHDPRLERTTNGTGLVAEHTLAELQQLRLKDPDGKLTDYRIPTLDQTLEWARGRTVLVLDQKDVPVEARVKKIQEHRAQAFAMLIVYNFRDAQACHARDANIMMEVMIPNREQVAAFEATGVPWHNVVAFVGHTPPVETGLYELIHSKGTLCLVGSSRNLDRQFLEGQVTSIGTLERDYREVLKRGADFFETDIPTQLGPMLFGVSPEVR